MNRRFSLVTAMIGGVALIVVGGTVDLQAQRGGGAGRGRPTTTTTHGQGRPATAGKPDTAGRPETAGRPDTAGKPDKTGRPDTAGKPTKTDRADGTTGRPTVGDELTRNTKLATRLQGLFPPGTDLQKASADFKNLGQFVAAAHVSQNHPDISFDALKAKMTGPNAVSLGDAIHELKPAADAKTEAQKAEKAAEADIKDSNTRS